LTQTAAPEVVTMTGKFECSTDKPVTPSEPSEPTPSSLLLQTPHLSAAPQSAHFHLPQPWPPNFEGGGSNFGVGFKQEKYPGPIHVTSIANDGLVACHARAAGQVHTCIHACAWQCLRGCFMHPCANTVRPCLERCEQLISVAVRNCRRGHASPRLSRPLSAPHLLTWR
jgi:hypothetical protein